MKLAVKNLGAIKNGELSFDKNLVIFTGPNNTGKSYLTYLIHAIHNSNTLIEPDKFIVDLENILMNSDSISESMKQHNAFFLKNAYLKHKKDIDELITNSVRSNFIKIFASNKIGPDIRIELPGIDFESEVYNVSGFKVEGEDVHIIFADGMVSEKSLKRKFKKLSDAPIYLRAAFEEYLINTSPFGKSYIFPSERTAINLFARDIIAKKAGARDDIAVRVLSGEDIAEIAKSIEKEQNVTPKYPLAINDYLNFVNTFEGSDNITEFNHIALDIELKVMGGAISVSNFKQVVFTPNETEHELNLHESSSLVKSLSFLVIYLRHFASKGDWVIIDEPEINLHPSGQVAIARIFAQMINSGIKLIISTHSDYLIKEFNTLIQLNELSNIKKYKSFVSKKGYKYSELLNKESIGAYYLNNGHVSTIDVGLKGIAVPSIDKTIDDIDNLGEEIYFKLSEEIHSKTLKK